MNTRPQTTTSSSELRSDTLNILLCNRLAESLTLKQRAEKLSRCCQLISLRTKDETLFETCRNMMKQYQGRQYIKMGIGIDRIEKRYLKGYK